MNECINHKGVYRTALATPGMLIIPEVYQLVHLYLTILRRQWFFCVYAQQIAGAVLQTPL